MHHRSQPAAAGQVLHEQQYQALLRCWLLQLLKKQREAQRLSAQ